jgi:S-adenosylmethionine decarboxylase proenzyme
MNYKILGRHFLVDYFGCDIKILDNIQNIKEYMLEAARLAEATIITDVFHQFSPQGVSGVIVIGESHFAIHTWPEFATASIDLFTCSAKMNPIRAIEFLKQKLQAKKHTVQEFHRGKELIRKLG